MRVDDGKGHIFHYDIFTPPKGETEQGIGLNDVCVIESITDTNRPINVPDFYIKIATYVANRAQWFKPKINGQINPVPPELTADSEPNTDEWGPDNYWGPGTYIAWHQLNKQQYGKAVADAKMINAVQTWGTGGVEFDYCYNDNFRNYFTGQGIDVTTLFCSAEDVIGDVVDTAANVTQGASNASNVFKIAAPFLLIGAGVIAVDKFVYPLFKRT